ncbi:hypothetical protein Tco_0495144, partial [Tanacetum coccineum]
TIEALIARLSNIVDPELDEEASKTRLDSYLFDHIGPNLQLLMPLPELVSHPNTPGLTSGSYLIIYVDSAHGFELSS